MHIWCKECPIFSGGKKCAVISLQHLMAESSGKNVVFIAQCIWPGFKINRLWKQHRIHFNVEKKMFVCLIWSLIISSTFSVPPLLSCDWSAFPICDMSALWSQCPAHLPSLLSFVPCPFLSALPFYLLSSPEITFFFSRRLPSETSSKACARVVSSVVRGD